MSNLRKWVCSTCKNITASQRDNMSMWWDPAGSRMPCCERTASRRAREKTWVIKSLKPPQLLPVKTVAKLMLPSNTNTVWARTEIFNQIHWKKREKKRLWVTLWGLDFREIVIEDIWVRYIISRTKPKHGQKSPAAGDKSSPFLKMLCPIDKYIFHTTKHKQISNTANNTTYIAVTQILKQTYDKKRSALAPHL